MDYEDSDIEIDIDYLFYRFETNLDMFDFSKEDLLFLKSLDPSEYIKEENIYKVTPIIKQISDYTWAYQMFDLDDLANYYKIDNLKRYKKLMDFSKVCSFYMMYLLKENCNHPLVSAWDNVLNAQSFYDLILEKALELQISLNDSEFDSYFDEFFDNMQKDIVDEMEEVLTYYFKNDNKMSDKQLLSTLCEIANSVCTAETLMFDNDRTGCLKPINTFENKKHESDLFVSCTSAKANVLSNFMSLIKKLEDTKGDQPIIDIDTAEIQYRDQYGNVIDEEDVDEEFKEELYEEIENQLDNYKIENFTQEIDRDFLYFKGYQYRVMSSFPTQANLLSKCKKMSK